MSHPTGAIIAKIQTNFFIGKRMLAVKRKEIVFLMAILLCFVTPSACRAATGAKYSANDLDQQAVLLSHGGHKSEAMALLRKAIAADPSYWWSYLLMGQSTM